MLTDRTSTLLNRRRLDVEMMASYGVETYEKDDGGDWIMIPYFQNGKLVNRKYRTLTEPKKFFQDEGGAQIVWNEDCLRDDSLKGLVPIITEGEMDAFAAIQSNLPRTVSVPNGAPQDEIGADDSGKKYRYLDSLKPLLKDEKTIIIAVDGDEKGNNLLNDLALRLGKARCKWVKYPKGCKDLNDVLRKFGPDGVRKVIAAARWYKVKGVFRMSELPPLPTAVGIDPVLDGMDGHARIRGGDLWVITGIPQSGKTTFVNDMTCHWADKHNWTIAFASFEQTPQTDHRRNLRRWYNRRPERDQSEDQLAAADAWIDEHFLFLVPDEEESPDLAWLLEKASVAVIQQGAKVVVIDPWNEMEHPHVRSMSTTEYVGEAIKELHRFARKFNVLVIVVAHPHKLERDRKTGELPMPTPYDISDSAHWANKPEIAIVVHPRKGGETLVWVAKVRFREVLGEPGEETYRFNPYQGRFERTSGVKS
jgi:twinkle protein